MELQRPFLWESLNDVQDTAANRAARVDIIDSSKISNYHLLFISNIVTTKSCGTIMALFALVPEFNGPTPV